MRRGGGLARLLHTPGGFVGGLLLIFVLVVAFVGPLAPPHLPNEIVGVPSGPSTPSYPFGTDFLGRDVLSRVVAGGRTVVLIGFVASVIAYVIGGSIGIYFGLGGGLADFVGMRVVDILLTVPGILLLLLLASSLGRHTWVLVLGVVIVLFPPISRVVRTATLGVSRRGYVEAAIARGDSVFTVCRRDILPNILPNVLADFGVRFSVSILLVAGLNFLGLGLTPPTADWGLMTSENQSTISVNPWAVIAPAAMLAILSVSVNLLSDAYLRTLGSSEAPPRLPRRRRRQRVSAESAARTEHALTEQS